MRRFVAVVIFLLCLSSSANRALADEKRGIDQEGFVCRWLLLAPIDLGPEPDYIKALNTDLLKGEAKIRPKVGECIDLGEVVLTWRQVAATNGSLDFQKILGGATPDAVAYVAVFIDSPQAHQELQLRIGSDDMCRVWLNGKEVIRVNAVRPLKKDSDSTAVSLVQGKNILLAKVLNGGGDFGFCARFTDADGRPIAGLAATLNE